MAFLLKVFSHEIANSKCLLCKFLSEGKEFPLKESERVRKGQCGIATKIAFDTFPIQMTEGKMIFSPRSECVHASKETRKRKKIRVNKKKDNVEDTYYNIKQFKLKI